NPNSESEDGSWDCSRCYSYSALLPVGFAVPPSLPKARCALAAPFHPCCGRSRSGLFSVALSLGSPPPAVSRHRVSVEPGLSSTRDAPRPLGRLTGKVWALKAPRSRQGPKGG